VAVIELRQPDESIPSEARVKIGWLVCRIRSRERL
jgi:hypothetical protein